MSTFIPLQFLSCRNTVIPYNIKLGKRRKEDKSKAKDVEVGIY